MTLLPRLASLILSTRALWATSAQSQPTAPRLHSDPLSSKPAA
jgi:hypothetical protein